MNCLVFIVETKCVLFSVGTESLNIIYVNLHIEMIKGCVVSIRQFVHPVIELRESYL